MHSKEEIQECIKVKFDITSEELLQKHKNGRVVFYNNVDLALANLQVLPMGVPCTLNW